MCMYVCGERNEWKENSERAMSNERQRIRRRIKEERTKSNQVTITYVNRIFFLQSITRANDPILLLHVFRKRGRERERQVEQVKEWFIVQVRESI